MINTVAHGEGWESLLAYSSRRVHNDREVTAKGSHGTVAYTKQTERAENEARFSVSVPSKLLPPGRIRVLKVP